MCSGDSCTASRSFRFLSRLRVTSSGCLSHDTTTTHVLHSTLQSCSDQRCIFIDLFVFFCSITLISVANSTKYWVPLNLLLLMASKTWQEHENAIWELCIFLIKSSSSLQPFPTFSTRSNNYVETFYTFYSYCFSSKCTNSFKQLQSFLVCTALKILSPTYLPPICFFTLTYCIP